MSRGMDLSLLLEIVPRSSLRPAATFCLSSASNASAVRPAVLTASVVFATVLIKRRGGCGRERKSR
jgi:hypothetical protein